MLRRMLLAAIGLAAVVCLGGCVVHGHAAHGTQTKKTMHHSRVFNVKTPSHHAHHGSRSHAHADGDKTHKHDKSSRNDHDNPSHNGRRRSHGKSRYESRKNHKD